MHKLKCILTSTIKVMKKEDEVSRFMCTVHHSSLASLRKAPKWLVQNLKAAREVTESLQEDQMLPIRFGHLTKTS